MKKFLIFFPLFIGIAAELQSSNIPQNNNKDIPVKQGTKNKSKKNLAEVKKNLKKKL